VSVRERERVRVLHSFPHKIGSGRISEHVRQTSLDQGHGREQLVRHFHGFDHARFFPVDAGERRAFDGAVRRRSRGARLASPASERGKFLVAGEILPD
jgi:hypothetical protein